MLKKRTNGSVRYCQYTSVSHIPAPRDGRDYDPDVLQQAVNDAVANIPVPADGKSITPDDVRPMLEQMV
ncbi:hypothetical protein F7E92_28255, partial [Escherichia coli]